jgi:hypothetical protein
MPRNVKFKFDDETALTGVEPIATDLGLFYGFIENVVEWAWWTNAIGDGDFSNSQNWTCKNAGGGVIENALPALNTCVLLPESLNIQIPENGAFDCRVCVLSNAILAADCDLRGLGDKLKVAHDAIIDLNGHKLYARAAAFTGVCTVKGKIIDHADDLTTTDASRVSSLPFNSGNTPASNLFNNNYKRGGGNTERVLVPKADWPLTVIYDFGDGGKVIDAYRMWVGPLNEIQRMPKRWRFEGANDINGNWTPLDSRNAESEWSAGEVENRTYTFNNQTAYRYYRIIVEENCGGADKFGTFLELVQLEYFHLKPTQGELHLSTTSAVESVKLYDLSLTGNMRFFIEGSGLLWLGMEGQKYIGGTEICGGKVSAGLDMTSLQDKDIFGEKGSEVVIRGDGTRISSEINALVAFAGKSGYTGYKYVLDGGILRDPGDGTVTEFRMTADSSMETSSSVKDGGSVWFGWTGSNRSAYADLGGHELFVEIEGKKYFVFANLTIENGQVYAGNKNGTFQVANSVVATNNVSFWLNSNANNISGSFFVRDYTQIRSFANYNLGSYDVNVYGTFTPSNEGYFHGTTLHDGSVIDLSKLAIKTLNVVAPYNNTSTANGVKTLHFANGATIGVKFGSRIISQDTPLISWTNETMPDNSVKFVCADEGVCYPLEKRNDGLYLIKGMCIIVR